MGFAQVESWFNNLKVFNKCCITFWIHPVLGIHKPKSMHDTMGWKPNFKLSNQSFSSTLLKQIEPWTYCLHEGEKTIKELEKNWRQRAKRLKVARLTLALVLHQWFNNNKDILCYHRRHHGLQVPMNCPNVPTIQFKGQMWNSIFHINYPTCGYSHAPTSIIIWKSKSYQKWT